jgi:DNA-binding LacI/PurR family transcriptional regulator
MSQPAQHLVELGHRDIAIILPPKELMFSLYRWNGFRQTMDAHRLTIHPDWKIHGDLTEKGGYAVAQHLLGGKRRPTAIVAGNDLMAIGAMRAAREKSLTVGQDVSVVGFDDITLAEHAHPALTTVRQPIYEIGRRVCRMLIKILAGESLAPAERQVLFDPQLVTRDSTGPPPG